jgi:hypothetical protein
MIQWRFSFAHSFPSKQQEKVREQCQRQIFTSQVEEVTIKWDSYLEETFYS